MKLQRSELILLGLLALGLVASSITFSSDVLAQANLTVLGAFSVEDNILTVDTNGHGEYTTIQGALDAIGTTLPAASSSNRYLILVAPGTYSEQVTMKSYVDVEGAGEDQTTIQYIGSDTHPSTDGSSATLIGADNAQLRFVRVESDATGNDFGTAIHNDGQSPSLLHVTASASGASSENSGVYNMSSSSPTMNDVIAGASGGTYNSGVYNTTSSSPAMTNVTASASGATNINYGVANLNSSSPTMSGVTASASGGTYNYGVYNNSSSPTMSGATASGSGGTYAYGMSNFDASPTMSDVTASASGGTYNYGVFNFGTTGSYSVTITSSRLTGSTYSLLNDTEFTTHIGASTLDGPIDTTGTVVCAESWNGSHVELDSACALASPLNHPDSILLVDAGGKGEFTTITAALNAIGTTLPAASSSNRYLIQIAPGTYSEQVTMKSYVDIEGSGEDQTTIHYTGSDTGPTTDGSSATVRGADNAELRFVRVESDATGHSYGTAIHNDGQSPSLLHVTASASGGSGSNRGVYNGNSSSPTMTNVTASASGGSSNNYGVHNTSSSPTMSGVTASASGASNDNFGVYNTSSSPTMSGVTASASGASNNNYAVYNISSSSPTMNDIIASASGGSTNYGVLNANSSSPAMTNVTANATGGSTNLGVFNQHCSPTLNDVTASASSASGTNYGVRNYADTGSYSVTITNSQLTGSTKSILNDTEFTTNIGASTLDGPIDTTGTVVCAESWTVSGGQFTALTYACSTGGGAALLPPADFQAADEGESTPEPTAEPTETPTLEPTETPTLEPTAESTDEPTPDVEATPDATQGTFDVKGAVAHISDAVNDLLDGGSLTDAQASRLLAMLERAIARTGRGREVVAVSHLNAFIDEVNALVGSGVLTPDEGQSLTDAAQAIIDALTA